MFTNATTSPQRAALALGIDPHLSPLEALKAWMAKRQTLKPHKPAPVNDAPFLENSFKDGDVDLQRLPVRSFTHATVWPGIARTAAPISDPAVS